MTSNTATCDLCGKPVQDTAYVCPRCANRTAEHLAVVTAVASEVEVTVARLARYSDRHGRTMPDDDPDGRPDGGLKVTPLPFDPSARSRGNDAGNTITTWARHAAEERGGGPVRPAPVIGPLCRHGAGCRHESCSLVRNRSVPHPIARAAEYLLRQLEWLRHRPEAKEAFDELDDACRTLVQVVDAPPPLSYAGPCYTEGDDGVCMEELYARTDHGTVKCPACKTRHDVAERRLWLLQEADDVLAHASLIAAALTVLDQPVTASMVRNYADRGRITSHGVDERGRPLYRVREVRAVVADVAYRRAARVAA